MSEENTGNINNRNKKTMWGVEQDTLVDRDGHNVAEENPNPTPVEPDEKALEDNPWLKKHPEPINGLQPPTNPFLENNNNLTPAPEIKENNENAFETADDTEPVVAENINNLPDLAPNALPNVFEQETETVEQTEQPQELIKTPNTLPDAFAQNSTDVAESTFTSNTLQENLENVNDLKASETITQNLNQMFEEASEAAKPKTINDLFDAPAAPEAPWKNEGENTGYNNPQITEVLRRNRKTIDAIRSLGQTGDIELQNVIKKMTLTNDKELDEKQLAAYRKVLRNKLHDNNIMLNDGELFDILSKAAYDELLGLGPLGPLWRDEDIADIMVTGPKQVIIEKHGKLEKTDVSFDDIKHLQEIGRNLSQKLDDRAASRANPIVTAQLPGGRIQIVWEPISQAGCDITIRKHRKLLTLQELLNFNSLNHEIASFIADAVAARASILVSGGTGSGKTTWLNIASSFIPDSERVLVLEDARELKLANTNVSYLLTKTAATLDDTIVINLDQLLNAALRMRPDRIIVGEIITNDGAYAVLEAAYTGHDGTMTTIHANSGYDALKRMSRKLSAATGMTEKAAVEQVWDTFDMVLHTERDNVTGHRYIKEIAVPEKKNLTCDSLLTTRITNDTVQYSELTPPAADTLLAQRLDIKNRKGA